MQTVSKIIKTLMRTNPYYGLFLCGLNKRFSNEIKTAGVCFKGINHELIINKDWWYSLDNDMREAVLHHEVNVMPLITVM